VPEKFWLALLRAVDRTDIAKDERFKNRDGRRQNYEALEAMLAPVFAAKTRQEWLKQLEADDVPAAPLYNVAEVLADPQVKHLDLVEELTHPQAGRLKFVGAPVRYDGLAREKSAPPPLLGAHTRTILTDLGYDQAAIDELVARGVTKVDKS
jgi:crotonobetainyl-CoA:carnitine CoA-transferase CaiB-like acyl-CoA transferase